MYPDEMGQLQQQQQQWLRKLTTFNVPVQTFAEATYILEVN